MRFGQTRFRLVAIAVVVFGTTGLYFQSTRDHTPEQPIAFSHKIHAGDFQMNCFFCHDGARRSPVAGIPSVQRCVGCHNAMTTDTPEIQKLKTYWDDKKPIQWARVHKLPEFTRFNHKRHVAAGVSCQTCHGPVETMAVVRQVSSLEMGWCLDCHKQRGAAIDCLTCHH
ncbi:MAG: cytochrome c3 family protein [Acidobacteria bacterium]|nr:cytochrome c3 family protein [Acidobacteriota bacterium]